MAGPVPLRYHHFAQVDVSPSDNRSTLEASSLGDMSANTPADAIGCPPPSVTSTSQMDKSQTLPIWSGPILSALMAVFPAGSELRCAIIDWPAAGKTDAVDRPSGNARLCHSVLASEAGTWPTVIQVS